MIAEQNRVTHAKFTPQPLAALSGGGSARVDPDLPGGGLPGRAVDRGARATMINDYGPTETTVDVAISAPPMLGSGVVPIGSPVSGAALFVLDGWLRPVPVGVVGSCMWPVRGGVWVLAPGRVDGVAVCGVSVWWCGGADVSHRGFGGLGC